MKKFKFSLHVLLNVRIQEEKGIKNELAEAQERLSNFEQQLKQTEMKMENHTAHLQSMAARGSSVGRVQECYLYLERLKKDTRRQSGLVKTAQKVCDTIMARLIETRKSIKMLETLKAQKLEEYKKEVFNEEMKLIDDFVNSRSARQ